MVIFVLIDPKQDIKYIKVFLEFNYVFFINKGSLFVKIDDTQNRRTDCYILFVTRVMERSRMI